MRPLRAHAGFGGRMSDDTAMKLFTQVRPGGCERCRQAPPDDGGRYCPACKLFLEVERRYEIEHRQYLNDFCARAKREAERQAARPRLPAAPEPVIIETYATEIKEPSLLEAKNALG